MSGRSVWKNNQRQVRLRAFIDKLLEDLCSNQDKLFDAEDRLQDVRANTPGAATCESDVAEHQRQDTTRVRELKRLLEECARLRRELSGDLMKLIKCRGTWPEGVPVELERARSQLKEERKKIQANGGSRWGLSLPWPHPNEVIIVLRWIQRALETEVATSFPIVTSKDVLRNVLHRVTFSATQQAYSRLNNSALLDREPDGECPVSGVQTLKAQEAHMIWTEYVTRRKGVTKGRVLKKHWDEDLRRLHDGEPHEWFEEFIDELEEMNLQIVLDEELAQVFTLHRRYQKLVIDKPLVEVRSWEDLRVRGAQRTRPVEED